jgi:hypothetical protein
LSWVDGAARRVAVIWNGIVSIFVYQAIDGWQSGRGSWFMTLFMVLFVLIGLGAIGAAWPPSPWSPRAADELLAG